MPIAVHSDEAGSFEQPFSPGGAMQINAPNIPTPFPTQLAISATYDTGILVSDGYKALTVAIKADHAGSLVINRFVDIVGTILQATVSTPIVATVPLIVNVYDNLPYMTYQVQIVNSGGAVMNIVAGNFVILQNAT